tara:strand:- start:64 stop:822 length:759 start_codon:yes stop_codon:yes gene_type:complete
MKSISELKSEAYISLSEDWGNAIGFTFVLFCISIAASIIPYIGDLIGLIIAGPLAFGTALFFLKVSKGEKGEIEDLFQAFKSKETFFSSLSAYFFTVIILVPILIICVVIWVALFLGDIENISSILVGASFEDAPYTIDPSFLNEYSSPLFESGIGTIILSAIIIIFVPLIIVSLLLSQVFFVLADEKTSNGFEAIKMSWNVMKGKKMKLFLLQLSFIGWAFLSVLTFFIGFLFLYPYMLTTYSKFYQNLYD